MRDHAAAAPVVGLFGTDPQGRVEWADPVFLALVARPEPECVGRRLDEVLPVEAAAEVVARVVAGEPQALAVRAANGPLHLTLAPRRANGSVAGLVGALAPTPLLAAEREGFLEGLLVHAPLPLYVVDRDLRVRVLNAAGLEVVGKRAEDVRGHLVADLVPAPAERYEAPFRQVLEMGTPLAIDQEYPGAGGMRVFHSILFPLRDPGGRVEAVGGVSLEISGHRRAVESLRASEARIRLMMDSAGVAIAWLDLDGRFKAINEPGAAVMGIAASALVGCTLAEVFPPEVAEQLHGRILAVAETGRRVQAEDHLALGGEERWLLSQFQPVTDDGGTVTGVLVVSQDVGERRRAEEAVRQAQRLDSLGVLATGLAHDFNNLLMAITGHLGLAVRHLPADSPARRHLERSTEAAQRAADLTRKMLDYAGQGSFAAVAVDVGAVVEETVAVLGTDLPARVRLEKDLHPASPIPGDMSQVRQVVASLVRNGIESLGEAPGRVRVETAERNAGPEDHRYTRFTGGRLASGRYVELKVTDDGCGMDEATVLRIFDPFFTTKFTGRGLGLAAVLGIVRVHRGGLDVESEPGKGTQVTVLFPLSREPRGPAPSAGENGGAVLVVDDEAAVRDVTAEMLEAAGFQVLRAGSGAEGVEICRRQGAALRLVVLDLSMPGLSGADAARLMRAERPDLKILLCSGYSESEALQRFAGQGMAGYLQKPYPAQVLVREVRRCLEED